MRFRVFTLLLAFLLGCSDLACPDGDIRVEGVCQAAGLVDPEPRVKAIPLACANNLGLGEDTARFTAIEWELTVDPRAIESGKDFGARFKVFAGFSEFMMTGAQVYLGGAMTRLNVKAAQATVLIRRGAVDAEPQLLRFEPSSASLPWTCRYDELGNAEFGGRDFPVCSPGNDNPDGSNDDCTGLGGEADPANPCGQFKDVDISEDCSVGGVCDRLGKQWPVWPAAVDLCDVHGFCVLGPVEVPLEAELDGFVAEESGHVLFGLDDQNSGWELDLSNGPNHGGWKVEDADYDAPPGPNSVRVRAGETPLALECTMAISSYSVFAEETRDQVPFPAPDHLLISFPIQEP